MPRPPTMTRHDRPGASSWRLAATQKPGSPTEQVLVERAVEMADAAFLVSEVDPAETLRTHPRLHRRGGGGVLLQREMHLLLAAVAVHAVDALGTRGRFDARGESHVG